LNNLVISIGETEVNIDGGKVVLVHACIQ